jgi:hypothetical protein
MPATRLHSDTGIGPYPEGKKEYFCHTITTNVLTSTLTEPRQIVWPIPSGHNHCDQEMNCHLN